MASEFVVASKVVQHPRKGQPRTNAQQHRNGNGGNGGDSERLARLEERVEHLKENAATKVDIAEVNGRLDVILEKLGGLVTKDEILEKVGSLVTKDELKKDRRWLIGTLIALAMLAIAVLGLLGTLGESPDDDPKGTRPNAPANIQAPSEDTPDAQVDAGITETERRVPD